jgi:hypothetical protein
MRKQLPLVLLAILLVGFILLGVRNIRSTNQRLQFNEIELKSKETQLIELNTRYDEVIKLQTKTEKEKQEKLEKIKKLEADRERLERELQAKLNKVQADKQKLARSAQKASGTQTASAASISGSKQDWMKAAGIPSSQWQYVDYIVSKESSWNPNAVNPNGGACGLGQQLPCGKWPGAWNDPVAALKAQYSYVKGRYGGYAQAYSFWVSNSWY